MARDAVSAEPRAQVPEDPATKLGWPLLAIGLWLPAAGWVLGYRDAEDALVVETALGLALVWLAAWKLTGRSLAWGVPRFSAAVGVLLLIAPEVVRYGVSDGSDRPALAYVNSMLMGVLVIGLAVAMGRRQHTR